MKKLLLIALIAVGFVFNSHAQENVLKVNPLGLAFGSLQLGYEHALSDKSSFQIDLAYVNYNVNLGLVSSKATGFGVEGQYRFYVSSSKSTPRGWFFAPAISYSSAKATSGSLTGKATAFSGGILAGYQWVFGGKDSGFALDLNFGANYANVSTSGDISSVKIDGIIPRIGLALGYAW